MFQGNVENKSLPIDLILEDYIEETALEPGRKVYLHAINAHKVEKCECGKRYSNPEALEHHMLQAGHGGKTTSNKRKRTETGEVEDLQRHVKQTSQKKQPPASKKTPASAAAKFPGTCATSE